MLKRNEDGREDVRRRCTALLRWGIEEETAHRSTFFVSRRAWVFVFGARDGHRIASTVSLSLNRL